MSTKCPFKIYYERPRHVKKQIMTAFGTRTVPSTEMDLKRRSCGKDPSVLLRVDYEDLHHYHKRTGSYHDVFGFCKKHGDILAVGPGPWEDDGARLRSVLCLRGKIATVTVVESTENPKEIAVKENRIRQLDSIKSQIKRIMSQSNTKTFTPEEWRTIVEAAISEYTTEMVHDA